MTVTYKLIDKTLKNLGLTRYDKDQAVVYMDDENNPLIVYPKRPESETLSSWHLMMARRQVIERGLVQNQTEFEQALERAAA